MQCWSASKTMKDSALANCHLLDCRVSITFYFFWQVGYDRIKADRDGSETLALTTKVYAHFTPSYVAVKSVDCSQSSLEMEDLQDKETDRK
jgi:hypothetical protein